MAKTPWDNWRPALRIADALGVEVSRNEPKHYRWDGTTIVTSYPVDLLHDLAHFQVAPAWRRRKPGFGLGMEPTGGESVKQLVSERRSIREEELASFLGLCWAEHLGYDWKREAYAHSWVFSAEIKFPAEMHSGLPMSDRLDQLGVTENGVPVTRLARPWRVRKRLR